MNLSPLEIVKELDNYIIGQDKAKKAVAVALRNRYRRSKLPKNIRDEITPKNILMKGPTGVGKTEIARRLAKLVNAPLIKVEATKFTEVGYVGRDVESMVRDLVEVSIRLVKEEKIRTVEVKAKDVADKKIIQALFEKLKREGNDISLFDVENQYNEGKYDEAFVELEIADVIKPMEMPGTGIEVSITDMFGGLFPQKKKIKKLQVSKARTILTNEEAEKLIDLDSVNSEAIFKAEQEGIIFIDEIDKIVGSFQSSGPAVSREGVQRDILPIVEGCSVSTKYGIVKTDFILFIAAGAFHITKIEDLIPELQGRFPIRVNLDSLSKDDFLKILTQPKNAIISQYKQLLNVDGVNLSFTNDALEEIASLAYKENETSENIGARRLFTILESLLEEISFNAFSNDKCEEFIINKDYVDKMFAGSIKQYDLKKYVL